MCRVMAQTMPGRRRTIGLRGVSLHGVNMLLTAAKSAPAALPYPAAGAWTKAGNDCTGLDPELLQHCLRMTVHVCSKVATAGGAHITHDMLPRTESCHLRAVSTDDGR